MLYTSKEAEQAAILTVAQEMCAAIRTAPKTQGKDYLDCCIVTGGELAELARKMEELGRDFGQAFLIRDAGNLRSSTAAVLIGVKKRLSRPESAVPLLRFRSCSACSAAAGECVYGPIDLALPWVQPSPSPPITESTTV